VETLPGGLTGDDLRSRLDDAVGPDQWVYDFTDEWVVYRSHTDSESHLLQQTYTTDNDGRVTLTGAPIRVARRVTYDAHEPPSNSAGSITESLQEEEEPIMAHIQIDEAEHKRLTEAADKVAAIESERAAAVERAEKAEAQIAEAHKKAETATIARIIGESGVEFSKWERAGIESGLPRTEDGALDEAAFTERVKEAANDRAAAMGEGRVTGFGTVTESTTYTEADLDRDLGIQKGA